MMASGIAHDFNNLLTIINGNLEMARYVSRDENVSQLLGESAKALNRHRAVDSPVHHLFRQLPAAEIPGSVAQVD
jgi:hypothetical protein